MLYYLQSLPGQRAYLAASHSLLHICMYIRFYEFHIHSITLFIKIAVYKIRINAKKRDQGKEGSTGENMRVPKGNIVVLLRQNNETAKAKC